jgi:uncharacterized protein YbjT (DUF2867 family)
MASVFVTGATGVLGSAVCRLLLAGGHTPRVLSRRLQSTVPAGVELIVGDLGQGIGLADALAKVDAIIHCASDAKRAQATDVEGTHHLLEAARASAPHLIYPSIVGIDASRYGYYQAKRAAERLIEQGSLPWSILRATQFHALVASLIQSFGGETRDEVVIPDGMRFQSVDVEEVAAQLVALVERGPAGRVADFGGPEVLPLDAMVAAYLRIRGRSATIRSAPIRGDLYEAFRSGVNLLAIGARGIVTWDAWLRRRFAGGSATH